MRFKALVRIRAFQDSDSETGKKRRPEVIPAKYQVRTDLQVEVKRGTQTHDFDMKSGGQIIQPNTELAERAVVTGCW